MELTALALRSAAKKLRPYFQAHPVVVLTDQPFCNILHKPDLTGRMLQWAIELSEYGIEFQPSLSSTRNQEKKNGGLCESMEPPDHGSGVGLLLQSPIGEHLEQAIWMGFPPLTMKRNMRPSYPDWTSPWLYPSPGSGFIVIPNSWHSCHPLHQKAILLPIHVQVNPSVAEASTCNTIETKQADDQEWTNDIIGYSLDRHSAQGSQAGTQDSGASRPFHPDWGALVQTVLHKSLPSVPKPFRGPICPWPFAQWGMDIVGPFPATPAQKKFLLVAMDYFSKWVEIEAYAGIKDKDVTKFVWKNIICRFGIPQTIIADNGPQFDSIAFRNFCSELNIRNSYSTSCYPQSNGQAEAQTKTLITALKKRLEQAKGKWVEELPGVLWAYQTTPRRPTRNTPFALAYGMDAIISTEIGLPTIRTEAGRQDDANAELGRNLDWADEVRETASIRMTGYQQRASAHYNRKQTQPPTLLFALINATENPSLFFLIDTLSGVASLPPSAGHLVLRLMQRASVDSSRLFASASSMESLVVPRAADKLASACSNLKRNSFSLFSR
ncbi:Gag-Pol polyprotein [Vitis vinifera]|uniref:Gag-Pol polyprotein n=1 Tax=Vitis vinifera TaxID=29760 RepID=A0A438D989_VITVI|nr:Gag-Pol polyprotein [Vitis vinifera]